MTTATDTIAALATAAGRGAIGVLRLSGPEAFPIARRLVGSLPPPRSAALRDFTDAEGEAIDRGLVLCFPAPRSFTGEDVVELQGHGGPVVTGLLLAAACQAGARPARPGEFSERAFLNDRLDLAQAEAIADLIDAGSAAGVRAASRTLHGEFSRHVGALVDALIGLRADLEAALDFSDEDDVPWLNPRTLADRLGSLASRLEGIQRVATQGRRLREGLAVAIVGPPNAGKSTLLNRLARTEAAIVSPIAGTTRDLLREPVVLEGLPVNLVDTAGLRDTVDPVEAEGVRRAWAALAEAEVVLYVVDQSVGITARDVEFIARIGDGPTVLRIYNKWDQAAREAPAEDGGILYLSAANGAGIHRLTQALHRISGLAAPETGIFTARARHLDALARAGAPLRSAREHVARGDAPELVAEDLRLAQQSLDEITGRFGSEDLLARIFSSFCIGK